MTKVSNQAVEAANAALAAERRLPAPSMRAALLAALPHLPGVATAEPTMPPPNPRVAEAVLALQTGLEFADGKREDPFARGTETRLRMAVEQAQGALLPVLEQPYQPDLARILAVTLDALWRLALASHGTPWGARLYERMADPQVGDLVLETTSMGRRPWPLEALGVLRSVEDRVWNVQTLGQPSNVCRWENADFIAAPADKTRTNFGPATITRDVLVDALGDAGIALKEGDGP